MNLKRRAFIRLLTLFPATKLLSGESPAASIKKRPYLLNRFSIAGLQHYLREDFLRRIEPRETLDLFAEPENPHDPFAVAIFRKSQKLGYVPRSDNKHISRLLDQGAQLECRVVEVDPEAGVWNMVKVEVWIV